MRIGEQVSESGAGGAPDTAADERAEALWGEVVLLRYRLRQRDHTIDQLQELTMLQREKIARLEGLPIVQQKRPAADVVAPTAQLEHRPRQKLTAQQIEQIVELLRTTTQSQTSIGHQFGVTQSHVGNIKRKHKIVRGEESC